ncbi:hypothetical protein [Bradyrhizobium sp. McL0615]|uniref:hypothetical protein n=1 Tax=Bradyrhizobium sp. McL0615 TaxID=3415673 RepID=UPI003CE99BB6
MVKVLVTVHGIRDNGDWQDAVSELAIEKSIVERTERYKYGFFDILKFVFPLTRHLQVSEFRKKLESLLDAISAHSGNGPKITVHFAAHSFGTHVLYHALRSLSPRHHGIIGNVVLMGSVLPSEADVTAIALRSELSTIFNFCSTNDRILLLNAALPLNSGLAGRVGFKGQFEGKYLQQRYFKFGHSGYFADVKLRQDSWIAHYCLRALSNESISPGTRTRPRYGDLLAGFMRFSKFLTTTVILVAAAVSYFNLTANGYIGARQEIAFDIRNRVRLTALDVDEVMALKPVWPYAKIPRVTEFWESTRDELLSRILLENDIVYAMPVTGDVSVTMRESDMAFLAAHGRDDTKLSLFEPDKSIDGDLTYRESFIYQGRFDWFGFATDGQPFVALENNKLMFRCLRCGGWDYFVLPSANELSQSTITIHPLSTDKVLLFGSQSPMFVLDKTRPPTKVLFEDSRSAASSAGTSFDTRSKPVRARKLAGKFSSFLIASGPNVSLAVNIETGESLFVSFDTHDVRNRMVSAKTPGVDTERRGEFGQTYVDSAYVQYCSKSKCEPWDTSFEVGNSNGLTFKLVSEGDELRAVVNHNHQTYCLRMAALVMAHGDRILTPVSPNSQKVECSALSVDAIEGDELNIRDPFLRKDRQTIQVLENPAAMFRYNKVHSEFVADLDVSSCLSRDGPDIASDLKATERWGILALSCEHWMFFNKWGKLAEFSAISQPEINDSYPLFFKDQKPAVLGKERFGTLSIYDANGVVIKRFDKRLNLPLAVFTSDTANTAIWLEQRRLLTGRFSLNNGKIEMAERASPAFPALETISSSLLICGKHVDLGLSPEGERIPMGINVTRNEPQVLIPENSTQCNGLGDQTRTFNIEDGRTVLGGVLLHATVGRDSSKLKLRVAPKEGESIEDRAMKIRSSVISRSFLETQSPTFLKPGRF